MLFYVLPESRAWIARVLVSWNVGALMFVVLVFHLMTGVNAAQISDRYREEDPTVPVILIISVVAAILAMVSIVATLLLFALEIFARRWLPGDRRSDELSV